MIIRLLAVPLFILGYSSITAASNCSNLTNITAESSLKLSVTDKNLIRKFQEYANNQPSQVRYEAAQFRLKSYALIQKKQELYHALSQESQAYLNQEKEFKKQLLANTSLEALNSNTTDNVYATPQAQIVIQQFKQYATKVAKHVRNEIQDYRQQINEINQNKRILYQTLSIEAQEYLSKTRTSKKQLAKDLAIEVDVSK